jgi:hypothetical protein
VTGEATTHHPTPAGRCGCECTRGGWCGGCGHAGCGGRRAGRKRDDAGRDYEPADDRGLAEIRRVLRVTQDRWAEINLRIGNHCWLGEQMEYVIARLDAAEAQALARPIERVMNALTVELECAPVADVRALIRVVKDVRYRAALGGKPRVVLTALEAAAERAVEPAGKARHRRRPRWVWRRRAG